MSQLYKLEEVKSHNGQNGARTWIVLHDVVYDVTDYLQDHPGGAQMIEEVAGRDATKDFDDFGHSSDAKQIMKKFRIGSLVEEDKRANRNKATNKSDKNTIELKNGNEIIKRRRRFRFLFCA